RPRRRCQGPGFRPGAGKVRRSGVRFSGSDHSKAALSGAAFFICGSNAEALPNCFSAVKQSQGMIGVCRMSGSELQVSYRTDEDWTGQIIATVKSGEFSARGAAWFDRINVKQTFLAALRSFPLTA